MAKLKSKIASKYSNKPKRKLVLGGPEQELYLNNNTTYQAQDAPTMMLQNQFDTNEQRKAQQMTAIYGNQMARQLDYLQDQTAASEKRKQEEQAVKQAQEQAVVDNAKKQVTTAASLAGKEVAKTIATTGTATNLPSNTAGAVLSKADAKMLGVKSASRFGGQGMSATSYGSSLANLGVGLGLGLAGEAVNYFGNERDNKLMEQQGRSQYYDDTNYSRAEFNSQIGKSTLKAAGMGSAFGPVGTAIGAGVGLLYGTGKALTERRRTKTEDERGFKIGNKKFGDKLLFGNENVYDENLDPTVIEKRNREKQLKAMTDTATAMDNARMGSMMQSDVNTGFGLKNSTFEAKYGGSIKKLKGGVAKPIGKGAIEYVGKSHEQGGIDLPGNIEVEGGETEQNDYVFSATLKLPNGATYAQAHKNLIKSGASGEEIHQLALSQEAAAGRNPNQIKGMKFAKYGGPLQYEEGGEKPTLKERRKERLLNKFNKEYDAQIQELEGLPEDQIADKVNEMYKAFIKREGQLNYDIEDQKTFDKTDLAIDLFANTVAGTLGGAAGLGIGAPVGAGIGLGVGTAKALREYITSKRGTSRRLDKLEAQKAAGINFENNLIYNPKGKLANKYVEAYLKENPYISNAKDFNYIEDTIYSPTEFDGYNLATTQAADNYFKSREEEKQAALKNPPVPIKGKDASKLSRTETPKLAAYNLPNITVNNTSTFVPDEEPVTQTTQPVVTNPPVTATNLPAVTTNTTATNPPVTTQTNNPPVTTTNTNIPTTDNTQPTANPTYNTYNMPYQYTATNKGALDYSDPNVAGGIWAGDKYNTEWKPLVSGTMSDAGKADKVISYLENYNGQDAADVKAKIAGKTRDEKIAIINRLATDNKVGPFHNAVLEGINTTKETPPPVKEVPKENPKDESTPPPTIPVKNFELPPPTKYDYVPPQSNLGLIQAAPAIYPFLNRVKTKDVTPAIATGYVQPGAVGKINMGRITLNSERDDNRTAQAAMNQALQNMSGPGAVAGMLAAKTKADQQSMRIAQAEQNTNMGRAGEEAKINAGISQFNVGQAMASQQTNAQLAQANAARIQQANQFNRQLGYSRDVENREAETAGLDRAAQTIAANSIANAKIKADYGLAAVQDYSQAYRRYLDQVDKQTAKFGGVKKYVSRLGDLKNNRYKV